MVSISVRGGAVLVLQGSTTIIIGKGNCLIECMCLSLPVLGWGWVGWLLGWLPFVKNLLRYLDKVRASSFCQIKTA